MWTCSNYLPCYYCVLYLLLMQLVEWVKQCNELFTHEGTNQENVHTQLTQLKVSFSFVAWLCCNVWQCCISCSSSFSIPGENYCPVCMKCSVIFHVWPQWTNRYVVAYRSVSSTMIELGVYKGIVSIFGILQLFCPPEINWIRNRKGK